jgi:hypothetical protein
VPLPIQLAPISLSAKLQSSSRSVGPPTGASSTARLLAAAAAAASPSMASAPIAISSLGDPLAFEDDSREDDPACSHENEEASLMMKQHMPALEDPVEIVPHREFSS